MKFTDAELREVEALWQSGKSASDIGILLGRTRNSIIGKVSRMRGDKSHDVSRRKTPEIAAIRKRERQRRSNAWADRRAVKAATCEHLSIDVVDRRKTPVHPVGYGVLFLKRRMVAQANLAAQCAYIISPDGASIKRVCGSPVIDDHSYCEFHYELCHQPAARREVHRPHRVQRVQARIMDVGVAAE